MSFLTGREDSHPLDRSRGDRVPKIHLSQRRVELWDSHVGGDVVRRAPLLGDVQPGRKCRLVSSASSSFSAVFIRSWTLSSCRGVNIFSRPCLTSLIKHGSCFFLICTNSRRVYSRSDGPSARTFVGQNLKRCWFGPCPDPENSLAPEPPPPLTSPPPEYWSYLFVGVE